MELGIRTEKVSCGKGQETCGSSGVCSRNPSDQGQGRRGRDINLGKWMCDLGQVTYPWLRLKLVTGKPGLMVPTSVSTREKPLVQERCLSLGRTAAGELTLISPGIANARARSTSPLWAFPAKTGLKLPSTSARSQSFLKLLTSCRGLSWTQPEPIIHCFWRLAQLTETAGRLAGTWPSPHASWGWNWASRAPPLPLREPTASSLPHSQATLGFWGSGVTS